MKFFKALFGIARQLLRSMVGGWTLEAKSLLFLGVALVLPIGLAFWFVLEVVAEDLVMRTTQQSARDYARTVIAWEHVQREEFTNTGLNVPNPIVPMSSALGTLREKLVENPHYRHQFLTLTKDAYSEFGDTLEPASESEMSTLRRLERAYRELEEKRRVELAETSGDAKESYFAQFDAEDAIYADAGPVFLLSEQATSGQDARDDSLGDLSPLSPNAVADGMTEPAEGWYVYYHVVQFSGACIRCHTAYPHTQGPATPFHVVKVMLPFNQTKVGSPTTLAVMISIAMVTVAATLLVVHWVLRRLVLNPLQHLKHVSEEIIKGNPDTRANIDTGDEFDELADAFNRMLRHMTEGQEKLRGLNKELDVRVDQLAQANLKLYEANRLKSDFLANMSHELRTPLNSIIGFSDVLQDISSLTDKQRRYAQNIQKSGRLLLEMINDILDLAKVEAGKMNVIPISFSLAAMVEAQCDMLRSLADEKNMDLRCEVPRDMEPIFQDQAKLQQILTNLLSNAIKFTPDGGLITVQIGLLNEHLFYMTVTDTGVGIPEDDFEIIFEKFRQSNAILQNDGLKRQYSGTGLGLSIVKELCRLLGGEVRLTSQLGTGSKFQVIMPVHYHQPTTAAVAVHG